MKCEKCNQELPIQSTKELTELTHQDKVNLIYFNEQAFNQYCNRRIQEINDSLSSINCDIGDYYDGKDLYYIFKDEWTELYLEASEDWMYDDIVEKGILYQYADVLDNPNEW